MERHAGCVNEHTDHIAAGAEEGSQVIAIEGELGRVVQDRAAAEVLAVDPKLVPQFSIQIDGGVGGRFGEVELPAEEGGARPGGGGVGSQEDARGGSERGGVVKGIHGCC